MTVYSTSAIHEINLLIGESRSAALMDPDFAASKEIPDAHNQYIKQQKKHGHGEAWLSNL